MEAVVVSNVWSGGGWKRKWAVKYFSVGCFNLDRESTVLSLSTAMCQMDVYNWKLWVIMEIYKSIRLTDVSAL